MQKNRGDFMQISQVAKNHEMTLHTGVLDQDIIFHVTFFVFSLIHISHGHLSYKTLL